jgi:hypothetical protein
MVTDPDRLARWEGRVRARYGGLTSLLGAAGAFRWSHSPILWLATGSLVFAVLVCTVRRWRGVWRWALRRPVRWSESAFDRAAYTAELNVSSAANLTAVVRDSLARRGFHVRSEADGDFVHVRGDRNQLASMATLVTHAAVLALVLGVALSSAWGRREELTLPPGEAVAVGIKSGWGGRHISQSDGRSGLEVCNEGFTVMRYGDGKVAGYDAEVVLREGGLEAARGHIRLNQPLTYRGIAFSLQGYTSDEESYTVTLQAVRDPGYGVVVTAGLLMLLGLMVSFNLPYRCIHVRIGPEGLLRLVGRADRRAWGFRREFAVLVREIDRWANR